MSIISIFAGTYCNGEEVAEKAAAKLGYKVYNDDRIFQLAQERFNLAADKFARAARGKTSVFNKFTHEQERTIAYLRVIAAELIREDGIILAGRTALLIPAALTHVLSVCLAGNIDYKVSQAVKKEGVSRDQAEKSVQKNEEEAFAWADKIFGASPWSADLYDILIPMNETGVDKAVELIAEHAKKNILLPTRESMAALDDFTISAHVEAALASEGHNVSVSANDGNVTLTINKHTLMLSKLEDELKNIAKGLAGVKSVETRVGKDFHQADIYRRYDFDAPSKVLLVDDEQEFVQTLSDRLLMRDVGSAVVYDGKQALEFVSEDEPEVMVLDLNMPEMDGIEVLRRVKKDHPNIQVIILTGHGCEKDENLCMDLGAFAYLEKPVDIEVLSQTMRQANQAAKSCDKE